MPIGVGFRTYAPPALLWSPFGNVLLRPRCSRSRAQGVDRRSLRKTRRRGSRNISARRRRVSTNRHVPRSRGRTRLKSTGGAGEPTSGEDAVRAARNPGIGHRDGRRRPRSRREGYQDRVLRPRERSGHPPRNMVGIAAGARTVSAVNPVAAAVEDGDYPTIRIRRKGREEESAPAAARGSQRDPRAPPRPDRPAAREPAAQGSRNLPGGRPRAGPHGTGTNLPGLTPHLLRHTRPPLEILYGGEDGRGASVHEIQEMHGVDADRATRRLQILGLRVEPLTADDAVAAARLWPTTRSAGLSSATAAASPWPSACRPPR
jgi:hypothetical protein